MNELIIKLNDIELTVKKQTINSTSRGAECSFRSRNDKHILMTPARNPKQSFGVPWLAGVLEGRCARFIVFYCRKWRDRVFRLHGSDVTCTKYCK